MPHGNSPPKLVISGDSEIDENILAGAAHECLSASVRITATARVALQRRVGLDAVALLEKQHGRFTSCGQNGAVIVAVMVEEVLGNRAVFLASASDGIGELVYGLADLLDRICGGVWVVEHNAVPAVIEHDLLASGGEPRHAGLEAIGP